MPRSTPESIFSWRSLVGAAGPPRDPNEDEDEEDEEDGGDEDHDREPPVIREPDEIGHAGLDPRPNLVGQ